MNILVVCDSGLYAQFGTSFVHAQTAAYAALGHRVRVIVPYAIGKRDWDGNRFSGPIHRWDQDGVEVYAMRHLSLSNYGIKGFNLASALRVLPRRLDKLLEDFSPEIIHAHALGFNTEIGAWLKNRLGVPLVATIHGGDLAVRRGRTPKTEALCRPHRSPGLCQHTATAAGCTLQCLCSHIRYSEWIPHRKCLPEPKQVPAFSGSGRFPDSEKKGRRHNPGLFKAV